MTAIQQVLFELETPYMGHPYFVTGNALATAIARRVDDAAVRKNLQVSHGQFVPGEYGNYPPAASQDGYAAKLGQTLPPVEAYEDLFVFRDAAQRWLLDSRPRDAHNALDLQQHGDRIAFADMCWFGRPEGSHNHRRSMQWYLHAYLHTDGSDAALPLSTDVLEGLRVGGSRNYGFGRLSVADTQLVTLEDLDYSRLADADAYQLDVLTPYVLRTEHPDADDQSVPWWWGVPDGGLRRRETRLVDGAETYTLETVDHGQVLTYTGRDPVATARNGVLRVGTHSRFGFGELRVRPASVDRVPERTDAATGGES
ncbi:Uncharacterized protein HSRCO_1532 [Halanaeroarchaeum sp. HSR-CO]|uniref:hypothetical protein n=1 Tax=Halanaeroarchaeum sp. HSR-CO TaxID=2866382 RepID=UPI00217DC883|nr:hypothetical protein [Halanaeroarchaeum sp. HSR-CO]UWG47813.1 Uncharacterized protein HSRCO_1532 [Halanaeroarchaeum sp. HSR-CO]